MKITALDLQGAFLVELDRIRDERGFFARAWCHREFANAGIQAEFVQANLSHTSKKGSVRGMHYQEPPSKEGKLIRVYAGSHSRCGRRYSTGFRHVPAVFGR